MRSLYVVLATKTKAGCAVGGMRNLNVGLTAMPKTERLLSAPPRKVDLLIAQEMAVAVLGHSLSVQQLGEICEHPVPKVLRVFRPVSGGQEIKA